MITLFEQKFFKFFPNWDLIITVNLKKNVLWSTFAKWFCCGQPLAECDQHFIFLNGFIKTVHWFNHRLSKIIFFFFLKIHTMLFLLHFIFLGNFFGISKREVLLYAYLILDYYRNPTHEVCSERKKKHVFYGMRMNHGLELVSLRTFHVTPQDD